MELARAARAVVILAGLGTCGCGDSQPGPPSDAARRAIEAGETKWLTANGLRLKTKVYRSRAIERDPTLVIVLHGDSPIGRPSIQYQFAQMAAERLDNAVVVGLLRPGYTDGAGETSGGERGRATGDNYTPQVVDAIRSSATALKDEFGARAVVLAGHSGGAALAANLLGRWPGEAEAALLVACPCNVPSWQTHMMKSYLWPYGPMALVFKLPTESLSPVDLAAQVSRTAVVRMLVGENDDIAPPAFTREYARLLRERDVDVDLTVVPGVGHDILLEPIALDHLRRLVTEMTADGVQSLP